jgi:hypothetical protein
MRRIAVPLVLVALAACASPEIPGPSAAAIHGKIESVDVIGKDARVQVYRIDDSGLTTPDPFETVDPDTIGRFTTRVLTPGRYRVVYRSLEAPPSIATAMVPRDTTVVLRPVEKSGLVQLRASAEGGPVRCRLTEIGAPDGIPDVRTFTCGDRQTPILHGLRPGRWTLDLPEVGATTEVDVAGGGAVRELSVDPPAATTGAELTGVVTKLDGTPAAWMVVSVRPMSASGEPASRWGRYAATDRSGRYRIVGIPPGPSLVRVECREASARILPSPHLVQIPPSGAVHLGFVVEP